MNDNTTPLTQKYGLTEENGRYTTLAHARQLLHDSWVCATNAIAQPNTDELDDQGDYTAALVYQLKYMHDLLTDSDGDDDYIASKLLDLLNRTEDDITPTADESSFFYGYNHDTPISTLAYINNH